MEFKHQREIHSILKDFNPMTKICRKDSWSVHTCGRRKLASPRLVKLRKDYRAMQIPMKHLFRGAGNRLVTRMGTEQPVEDTAETIPKGETQECEDYSMKGSTHISVKAAGENLKDNLTQLLTESEHRKRYCINGGSVVYNMTQGLGSPHSQLVAQDLGSDVASHQHHAHPGILPPAVTSLGAVVNPSVYGLTLPPANVNGSGGGEGAAFMTGTDTSGMSPIPQELLGYGAQGSSKPSSSPVPPALEPLQGAFSSPRMKSPNLSFNNAGHPESPSGRGTLTSLHSTRTDIKEHLPPIQSVTASHVMGGGAIGAGKVGTFEQYTRKLFECPTEKPILKYERQVGTDEEDRKTLANDNGERADFIEFRHACITQLTEYYNRSMAELKRYETESRELFGQKFRTLDVPRLLSKKSASSAVASMENDIRNQHKRKQNELKKGIHQQWVQEFKAVIALYPQTTPVKEIATYVDEIICKDTREGSELSSKQFEQLIARLSRSHLLLDEIMSILHAIAPVFKTSKEQFAEIIRERLRPLFAKKKDEAGFDKEYKTFMQTRKRTSSILRAVTHAKAIGMLHRLDKEKDKKDDKDKGDKEKDKGDKDKEKEKDAGKDASSTEKGDAKATDIKADAPAADAEPERAPDPAADMGGASHGA